MPMPTVFISYSHKDKDLLGPMVAQLKALEQAGSLEFWVDTRIDAGEKWYADIEGVMQRAAVAVCLVSEHFLASDFCTKEEIPFLLKRTEQDGLLIIPDEAWEIAERGPMRLFLADIHLHRARLFFREATYQWESPTVDLAAARKLIEECGYGRRNEELEDAEAGLRQQHS
jgi:hypothetical protein